MESDVFKTLFGEIEVVRFTFYVDIDDLHGILVVANLDDGKKLDIDIGRCLRCRHGGLVAWG